MIDELCSSYLNLENDYSGFYPLLSLACLQIYFLSAKSLHTHDGYGKTESNDSVHSNTAAQSNVNDDDNSL